MSDTYQDIIEKVRHIVRIFRRSPTKNDAVLQKYVVEQHGRELGLILDCPTRWNSLVFMLSRFCTLKSAVQKAMIDLKVPMSMSEVDCIVAEEIVSTLEPVTLVVNALSRRDINLISAKLQFNFALLSF